MRVLIINQLHTNQPYVPSHRLYLHLYLKGNISASKRVNISNAALIRSWLLTDFIIVHF